MTDSREIRTFELAIPARDGYRLAASLYEPCRSEGAPVAIMTSSMGDRRERYAEWARFLARRGFVIVTFDYRGIGGSRYEHATRLDNSLRDWGEKDLAGVIAWVTRERAPRRLVTIAHSVGGQVLGFAPNHRRVDAVLAVGIQKAYWRNWDDRRHRQILRLCALAGPALVRTVGYLPGRVFDCDDLGPEIVRDWSRWALNPGFVDVAGRPHDGHEQLSAPILALSFEDDRFWAPRRAVDALLQIYRRAPSLHLRFDPAGFGVERVGHSGFFDAGLCPPAVWEAAAAWLARATRTDPALERARARLAAAAAGTTKAPGVALGRRYAP